MKLKQLTAAGCGLALGLAALGNAMAAGPRLFFTEADIPQLRARSESSQWIAEARRTFLSRADDFLHVETNPYSLTSAENGSGTTGRALQQRVGTLALAGHLTGEERYFRQARAILLSAVRQFRADDRKAWATHLQYSDAAQALAIGLDWLDAHLAPSEKTEVRARVAEFGELLYTDDTAWERDNPSVMSCNHNSVHFGALGLCALILGDRPEWLARATQRVRAYFTHFVDDTGYATEGQSYIGYGLLGAIPFAHALQRAGGPDLMAEQPLLGATGDQVLWSLLPGINRMRALNDNGPLPTNATVAYPMIKHGRIAPLWAWWQAASALPAPHRHGMGDMTQGLSWPFLLLAGDLPDLPAEPPAGLPLGRGFSSGRVFLRDRWDSPDAAHVTFTSGYDMHQGHNHQDENSVTLFALGEDFLTDPGYKPWESRHHTTLKLGRAEQVRGTSGQLLEYREDEFGAFVRGQAHRAYDVGREWIGHCDRQVYFVRAPQPYLVWCDDAQLETAGEVDFTARFVTDPANRIAAAAGGGLDIIGANAGAKCRLRVFNARTELTLTEDDLSQETFIERGGVYRTGEFLRRAQVTERTSHLRLVTVAFPHREAGELPEIRVHEREDRTLVCELTFADGRVDRVYFSADGPAWGEHQAR